MAAHRRTLVAVLIGLLGALAIPIGGASAHNSLVLSDPAEGEVLKKAPTELSLIFSNAVDLAAISVLIVDSAGNRSEIDAFAHGPSGNTEVVTLMPALARGPVVIRWRLVGDDGHVLSEKIHFSVGDPDTSTTVAPDVSTTPTPDSAAAPTATPTATAEQDDALIDASVSAEDGSVPGAVRWTLRFLSYLAILAVVGVTLTDLLIWPGAAQRPALQRVTTGSLGAVGVLALASLLVVASDISGDPPWSSFGDVASALGTDAGVAYFARIILAIAAWLILGPLSIGQPDVRNVAVGIVGLLLLGTWSWTGHARSQRWPEVGVVLDVVHHASAALWVGGLAVVGVVALRQLVGRELLEVVGRLSVTATVAIGAVLLTGVIQTVRIDGNLVDLLDTRHGVYVAIKAGLFAVMVGLGWLNRRSVRGLASTDAEGADLITRLRRTVLVEVALGVVVLGVTAALVAAATV